MSKRQRKDKHIFKGHSSRKKMLLGVGSIVAIGLIGACVTFYIQSSATPLKDNKKQPVNDNKLSDNHYVDNSKKEHNETITIEDKEPNKIDEIEKVPHPKNMVENKEENQKRQAAVETEKSNHPNTSNIIIHQGQKEFPDEVSNKNNNETSSNILPVNDNKTVEERDESIESSHKKTEKEQPSDNPPTVEPYLSAEQTHQIIMQSGIFRKQNNEYFLEDEWGYVLNIKVDPEHIGFIYFNGMTYYMAKETTYDEIFAFAENNKEIADLEWENLQNIIKETEYAVRVAAESVYGKDTEEANMLYQEILEGGKQSEGYFKQF